MLPSPETIPELLRIVRPQPGNPERGFSDGSEGVEADVQTSLPSVVRLPRLAVRRDLNGDIRDCSDMGSSDMTVDMRLSVVRSQITSS